MKPLFFPRAARGVRLLATLAVATSLVGGFQAAGAPIQAHAQSAGLDEYRFPAGGSAQGSGGLNGGSEQSGAAGQAVELPGGYPLTAPVVVLTALLLAGIAAGAVLALRRRARGS
jgi:hypothetical protein